MTSKTTRDEQVTSAVQALVLATQNELDLNNLKNSPSMTFSTAERLRRLREYRRAWRNLQWTTETTLQLTGDTILRLHGSILGRCEADTGSNRFDFMQVPSQFRNIPRKHWTLDIPDVQPNDFELDTLQNLLVVMERTEWYLQQSNVCDQYIGVMLMDDFEDGQVEFWIIDWKSGKVMLNLYSAYHDKAEGFAFLNSSKVVLPMIVPAEDSLQGTLAFLAVFHCTQQIAERKRFALAARLHSVSMFQLPEPAEGNYYARILMGSSIPSTIPAYPNPSPHLDNDVPFFADMHIRLLVFDVTVYDRETQGVMGHTFLVPSSALERRLRTAEGDGDSVRQHYRPHVWVRDMRLTLSVLMQSHSTVFQRRCIAPEFLSEEGDARVVALYETNYTMTMRKEITQAPETASQYFFEPYEDNDLNAWLHPVHTKMPFRRFVSDIDAERESDLHLAEDCFIIRCQRT
ncbi:hypothetical protein EIP86_003829 [Pleurotus ostreatoroseus]|nr:hypothetical protein EIP86_003829 [Pleurotus ostreatoroseus]